MLSKLIKSFASQNSATNTKIIIRPNENKSSSIKRSKPPTLSERYQKYDQMDKQSLIQLIVDLIKAPAFTLDWGTHQTAIDYVIMHYLQHLHQLNPSKNNISLDIVWSLQRDGVKLDDYLFYRRLTGIFFDSYRSILSDRLIQMERDSKLLAIHEFSKAIDQLRDNPEDDDLLIQLLISFEQINVHSKNHEIIFLGHEHLLEYFYGYDGTEQWRRHLIPSFLLAFEKVKPMKVIKFIHEQILRVDPNFKISENTHRCQQIQRSIRCGSNLKHFRYFTETMGVNWESDHHLIERCCLNEKFDIIDHLLQKNPSLISDDVSWVKEEDCYNCPQLFQSLPNIVELCSKQWGIPSIQVEEIMWINAFYKSNVQVIQTLLNILKEPIKFEQLHVENHRAFRLLVQCQFPFSLNLAKISTTDSYIWLWLHKNKIRKIQPVGKYCWDKKLDGAYSIHHAIQHYNYSYLRRIRYSFILENHSGLFDYNVDKHQVLTFFEKACYRTRSLWEYEKIFDIAIKNDYSFLLDFLCSSKSRMPSEMSQTFFQNMIDINHPDNFIRLLNQKRKECFNWYHKRYGDSFFHQVLKLNKASVDNINIFLNELNINKKYKKIEFNRYQLISIDEI